MVSGDNLNQIEQFVRIDLLLKIANKTRLFISRGSFPAKSKVFFLQPIRDRFYQRLFLLLLVAYISILHFHRG
jgi:hypothetical protein